ncbi:DUF4124 domain-containing protein [Dyella caseinilytica]|uniref:DUF4124 domain-containing protein n=1 Tax=Dyella caseinilytica TaxID=1849581 RepID=A0ABX7GSF3_9GAMM|nr:DUF4124 domain-containing protein [Dyella caseinilytica]QRN53190.1 DUF4124 domain-containing protein [Dyella caseinilytica]GGA12154.1 hypothetical protein GCM10011408_37030 [Dyella caseinilytica]
MDRLGALVLFLVVLLLLGLRLSASAEADTTMVYKCSSAQGQVIFQGTPCARGQQQQTMQLENGGPATSPLPAPDNAPSPTVATTPPPPALPRTPPSLMYRCINAVNGNSYFSNNGNPPPYYAPLAVTGIIPTPLGQTYAPPGHGAPTAATIASHYVQVQDSCQAMTPEDTCSQLRSDYDENERKLSRAFKSDQPPLLQRESELLAQLSHC